VVGETRRVLVVDDDPDIGEFVSLALSDEGYEVVTAPHGRAALTRVEERPPDLIVLDMRMPVMDGWEFARAYRERPGPHAPIIVFTAARDAAERAAAIEANGYLAKPFSLDELLDAVARHAQPA
jgi:two-component system, chemotaxis family, chemotaxis protein CheY